MIRVRISDEEWDLINDIDEDEEEREDPSQPEDQGSSEEIIVVFMIRHSVKDGRAQAAIEIQLPTDRLGELIQPLRNPSVQILGHPLTDDGVYHPAAYRSMTKVLCADNWGQLHGLIAMERETVKQTLLSVVRNWQDLLLYQPKDKRISLNLTSCDPQFMEEEIS